MYSILKAIDWILVSCCILLIKVWQRGVSPFIGSHCRFYPSCSQYALESFQKHGFIIGMFFAIRRLLKCNSLFEGGIDQVK